MRRVKRVTQKWVDGIMKGFLNECHVSPLNKERQKDRGKGSGNHGNSRKGRSKSRLGKIEFWNCRKKVHLKKHCRDPKKQRDVQQEKN
jgi:hypothetical protein